MFKIYSFIKLQEIEMKFKSLYALALLFCSLNISAFDVTGEHFDAKFKITSVTLGEKYSIINAESDAAGQYGKVYVSYKLKNTSDTGGTWTGQGRGISPEGNLARGNLQGVWTRKGKIIAIKSLDDVTDGINYMQGNIDLISGDIVIEVYKVD